MMMFGARAVRKNVRIAPRKARRAAGLIRRLPVEQARAQLRFCGLKEAVDLLKTLDAAVAIAVTQEDVNISELWVAEVRVDEGPRMKRSKPKNKGGRHPFQKRTSHFTVIVNKG